MPCDWQKRVGGTLTVGMEECSKCGSIRRLRLNGKYTYLRPGSGYALLGAEPQCLAADKQPSDFVAPSSP
jgi:hypothetical protein